VIQKNTTRRPTGLRLRNKTVPGKAKKEAQEVFIETYNRIKSQGKKIYFADSTHPLHNAVISYGWIKKG
jgi:hypothetical protein